MNMSELEEVEKLILILNKIKDEYDTGIKWFEFIKID